MTLNLPLLYFVWTEEYCQTSPNKHKSPNLWHVTSIFVCCIFAFILKRYTFKEIFFLSVYCYASYLIYTSLIFYWVPNSIATIMTIDQPTIARVSKYCPKILMPLTSYINVYRKVASSSLSWLVAHFWVVRLFMKGKLDAYVLRSLTKKV